MTQTSTSISRSRTLPRGRTALLAGLAFSLGFVGLVWLTAGRLRQVEHLPDQGAGWYFWKLASPTWTSRLLVWSLYLAHQLVSFGFIYRAQRMARRGTVSYSDRIHPINLAALVANAGFVLLHLVQTHVTYDGLAQEVHVFSSLAAVAVLLIWVLLMENPRRGLVFGVRAPIGRRITDFARKYHGYYFSWAIVYTFWFHPAEATLGHLWGFFYILLIMLQGSLFFTRIHTNRWWTLFLEVLVLFHAVAVARLQGAGLWPMFAFGFGGMFVITQMHGLSWSRSLRCGILVAYLVAAGWVYQARGFDQLGEVLRIPIIDLTGVLLLAAIFGVGLWTARRIAQFKS